MLGGAEQAPSISGPVRRMSIMGLSDAFVHCWLDEHAVTAMLSGMEYGS